MASRLSSIVHCAANKDPNALRQFRRPQSEVARVVKRDWKKRPLNRELFAPLKEEEKKKALRNPAKDIDPYDRLEFFEKGDLDSPFEVESPQTAMPVEDPHVVRATEARELILRKLEKKRMTRLREMFAEGELTQDDINTMYDAFKAAREDAAMPFVLEDILNEDADDDPVIYPKVEDERSIDRTKMTFTEQLTFDYNIPSYVEFKDLKLGEEVSTPVVTLSHCNGEEVVVSLHGGCILKWLDPNGKNRLFTDPDEVYDNERPIASSGIGFAFPQFGKSGPFPKDGFVNRLLWDVVRTEVGADWLPDPAPSVTLYCKDNDETRKLWPHSFEIYFKITLGESDDFEKTDASTKEKRHFIERWEENRTLKSTIEDYKEEEEDLAEFLKTSDKPKKRRPWRGLWNKKGEGSEDYEYEDLEDTQSTSTGKERDLSDLLPTQLRLQYTIRNTGDKAMEFMCASRTHLSVRGFRMYGEHIRILGLGGRYYLDYNIIPGRPVLRLWQQDYLTLSDRDVGYNAIFTQNNLNDVFFCPGGYEYYESITRKGFPDVLLFQRGPGHPNNRESDDQKSMLGRGCVTVPVRLEPGEKWEGDYILRHHNEYFTEPIFGYQGSVPPPDEIDIEPPNTPSPPLMTDVRN